MKSNCLIIRIKLGCRLLARFKEKNNAFPCSTRHFRLPVQYLPSFLRTKEYILAWARGRRRERSEPFSICDRLVRSGWSLVNERTKTFQVELAIKCPDRNRETCVFLGLATTRYEERFGVFSENNVEFRVMRENALDTINVSRKRNKIKPPKMLFEQCFIPKKGTGVRQKRTGPYTSKSLTCRFV